MKSAADALSLAFQENSLRCLKRLVCCAPFAGNSLRDMLVSVSAADPLNLIGIVTPGSRVSPVAANRVLYSDGLPVAIREAGEVRFLGDTPSARHWEIRNALIRRSVPPQLRAYLGQPA